MRLLENRTRFPGRLYLALGETNRNFFRAPWQTVDLVDADFICDFRSEPLPFADNSVDAFYASSFVEHISADCGLKLFREMRRCLKPGGCCRIITPDLELLIEQYLANDWAWFLKSNGNFLLQRVCDISIPPESLLIHNQLLGWLASYSGRLDTAGGPIADRELVDRQLKELTKREFRDWAVSLLKPDRVYAHILVYDFAELEAALKMAAFDTVQRTDFGQSSCVEMTGLDRPQHEPYSMCVEAGKAG